LCCNDEQEASPRKRNLATQPSFALIATVPSMNERVRLSTTLNSLQTLSCWRFSSALARCRLQFLRQFRSLFWIVGEQGDRVSARDQPSADAGSHFTFSNNRNVHDVCSPSRSWRDSPACYMLLSYILPFGGWPPQEARFLYFYKEHLIYLILSLRLSA